MTGTIQKYVTLGSCTPVFDRGDWNRGVNYATANIVIDNGVWYCFAPHTSTDDNRPGLGSGHAKYWRRWSQRGEKGDKGENGDPAQWSLNEILSGTNDSQNRQFVLAHAPSGPILLWYRGLLLTPGKDYTIEGAIVTIRQSNLAPGSTDSLLAAYPY